MELRALFILLISARTLISGKEGELCYSHIQCDSLCCLAGKCDTSEQCDKQPIPSICKNDFECDSYQCMDDKCASLIGNGCSSHKDCHNKCCYEGKCQFNSTQLQCASLPIGHSCSVNFECSNYNCKSSYCLSKKDEICSVNNDCESKCCINSKCQLQETCPSPKYSIGAPCHRHSECDSYACRNNICVGKISDTCRTHYECQSEVCWENACSAFKALARNGNNCSYNWECSLYTCDNGICKAENGVVCYRHDECVSGCCNEFCSENTDICTRLDSGSKCEIDANCKNYVCKNNNCLTLQGDSCDIHKGCNSSCCVNGKCGLRDQCPHYNIGVSCKYNYECSSSVCSNGKCLGAINSACINHNQCTTGCCSKKLICELISLCPMHSKGESCASGSECESYLCANNLCTVDTGELCNGHKECKSGCCMGNYCQESSSSCLRLEAGKTCNIKDDCLSYNCLESICVVELGEYCTNHANCESQCCNDINKCVSTDQCRQFSPGSVCYSNMDCSSYKCSKPNESSFEGICMAHNDEACKNHTECLSKCCYKEANVIAMCAIISKCLQRAIGDDCTYDNDCDNFYCNYNTRKCSQFEGKSCMNHRGCYFGCCNDDEICQKNVCLQKELFDSCSTDSECKSYKCSSTGKCKTKLAGRCNGFDDCETGCCKLNSITESIAYCAANVSDNCPFLPIGESCEYYSDCMSFDCSKTTKRCLGLTDEACTKHNQCISGCCGTLNKCLSDTSCPKYIAGTECNHKFFCASYLCASGICKADLGDECANHSMCNSTTCDNNICSDIIIEKMPAGSQCSNSTECQSYHCKKYICVDEEGASCSNHTMCDSGCCARGICSNESNCNYKGPGEDCSENYECQNYKCNNDNVMYCDGALPACKNHKTCPSNACCSSYSQCVELTNDYPTYPKCGKNDNESCETNSNCLSFLCEKKMCKSSSCSNHAGCSTQCCSSSQECVVASLCANLTDGKKCIDNSECKSYLCKNGTCSNASICASIFIIIAIFLAL